MQIFTAFYVVGSQVFLHIESRKSQSVSNSFQVILKSQFWESEKLAIIIHLSFDS